MKKFNLLSCMGIVLFFFSCEPQELPMEEEPITTLNILGPGTECFTIDITDFPEIGPIEGKAFENSGFLLSLSPNLEGASLQISDVTGSCPEYGKGLGTSSGTTDPAPSLVIDFPKPVFAVSVTLVSNTDQIVIKNYEGKNATGPFLFSSMYEGFTTCETTSIRGRNVSSVKISSSGEVPNSFKLVQITYCLEEDSDEDGVIDHIDNCVNTPNPGQENNDGDGNGDVCDTNDDNDSRIDLYDNCPLLVSENFNDHDADTIGDPCDPDDDNDGVFDNEDGRLSNAEGTIHIGYCNTGVVNGVASEGVRMSDLVDDLENGNYRNLGQEIRSFSDLTNLWVEKGFITGEEKSLILNCAIADYK